MANLINDQGTFNTSAVMKLAHSFTRQAKERGTPASYAQVFRTELRRAWVEARYAKRAHDFAMKTESEKYLSDLGERAMCNQMKDFMSAADIAQITALKTGLHLIA